MRILHSGRIALLCLSFGAWACSGPDLAENETAPPAVPPLGGEPEALETVPTAPVRLGSEPGDQPFAATLRTLEHGPSIARRIGQKTFQIALRSAELTQYPCTSCHTPGQNVVTRDRIPDAHQNIDAVHPKVAGGQCGACHVPDDVELLQLPSGETATLDHAYRLCAQCHFAQVDAWVGGAHGKRLDAWQGPRVVMGCTECHDPHDPTIPQRIPFPGPSLTRKEPHRP